LHRWLARRLGSERARKTSFLRRPMVEASFSDYSVSEGRRLLGGVAPSDGHRPNGEDAVDLLRQLV
jgi:hypothetical protein